MNRLPATALLGYLPDRVIVVAGGTSQPLGPHVGACSRPSRVSHHAAAHVYAIKTILPVSSWISLLNLASSEFPSLKCNSQISCTLLRSFAFKNSLTFSSRFNQAGFYVGFEDVCCVITFNHDVSQSIKLISYVVGVCSI